MVLQFCFRIDVSHDNYFLALPAVSTHISDVKVPAGTKMQTGKVAPQPSLVLVSQIREEHVNTPFITQYELLDRIPETNFKNMRPLE